MNQISATETAWSIAKRKARYGHRDQIVFLDRAGGWVTDRLSASAVKEALLAGGTKVRFYVIAANNAWSHIYRWSDGIRMIRNAKWGI